MSQIIQELITHAGCINAAARPLAEYLERYQGVGVPLTKRAFYLDRSNLSELLEFRNLVAEQFNLVNGEIKSGDLRVPQLFHKHGEREALGEALKQVDAKIRQILNPLPPKKE